MAEPNRRQRRVLRGIQAASHNSHVDHITWDSAGKSPKSISGLLSAASTDDPETVARRFIQQTAEMVELPNGVTETFETSNVVTDRQGFRHVTLRQVLNGVRVFEGSVQVHINPAGEVVGYKANRLTEVDASASPTVGEAQALDYAAGQLDQPESQDVPPETELVQFKHRDGHMYLAWHVRLFSDADLATYHYLIDADNGSVLYTYNDMRHVAARETYTANNTELLRGDLIISEGDESHSDQVAWDAHVNALKVYDYYKENFDRDSYDGNGATLRSTVHYGNRYNNAFWLSSWGQMVYGDGDGITFSPLSGALDIVAHELTHAVTSQTARFVYAEESGALDESFADFFAIMTTNADTITDWQLGEHVYTPGRPGDALRDISDPPAYNQPDHTDNLRLMAEGDLPRPSNDNGYVHTNSGIPNKAGYLMVAGGTHHEITVEALGKEAAQQIMYLALTVYLASSIDSRWSFNQARIATIDACEQLYPGDFANLSSVMNAWAAVGVGDPAPAEPPPPPQPIEPENGFFSRVWSWVAEVFRKIFRLGR